MFLDFQDFTIFLLIVFILFVLSSLVQLVYYWGVFRKLAFYKKNKRGSKAQAVSIVICAKNEYNNLKENLPVILKQDYTDYEVVVVNDFSDDETAELLEEMKKKYSHLKVINFTGNLNFFAGKKFPLSLGIKSAKNEILLLTDADCKPISAKWISQMVSGFNSKTDIVLGFSPYKKEKGLLNSLIRFDTLHIAIQYFSYSLIGKTYMGVGRNLAYRRSVFYKNKGFSSHYKIQSGDDDLFINSAATKTNTTIEIRPESHTVSKASSTFSQWFIQKRRHLSTSKYYKGNFKFLLGSYSLSQILYFLSFFILVFHTFSFLIVISIFLLRLISQLFIIKKCMNRLNEKELLLLSPLFELIFIILNILFLISGIIFKQNKWK
ncbi:MAG: glycosyltransferase [Bacteroidales bacterium]|nr:glycosyltransferase [Bacteroidales bacterium]